MTGPDIVQRALAFVGTRENPPGSNRGPQIDRWLREAGVEPGSQWCASWACSRDVWGDSLPRGFPLASAFKLREWGKANKRLVKSGRLQPGDLFVILHADLSGHVGIVIADHGDGTCGTIAGNESGMIRIGTRGGQEFAAVCRAL